VAISARLKDTVNYLHVVRNRCRNLPYYLSVIHYVFGNHPSVFFPLYRWREGGSDNIVQRDTRLVIEGYPRSGNTFAETAFKVSQPGAVKTADHVHVPAQIIRAARFGIPICLLIREPEDVVRSLVVKHTKVLIPDALKGYARFYEACRPYQDAFLVATYDQVTTDFGSVVRRINQRFGTRFTPFEHSHDNVKRVFSRLDDRNRRINGGSQTMAYYPNWRKEIEKSKIQLAPYRASLLPRCAELYEQYLQLATNPALDPDEPQSAEKKRQPAS
jgi:hypothetical protein